MINAAYEVLGKPERRADYDRRRAACALLSVLAVPAFLSGLLILALIVLQPNWR